MTLQTFLLCYNPLLIIYTPLRRHILVSPTFLFIFFWTFSKKCVGLLHATHTHNPISQKSNRPTFQRFPIAFLFFLFFYSHNSFAKLSNCSMLSSFKDAIILTTLSQYTISLHFSNILFICFAAVGAQVPFSINATVLF